jgi:hypothetical protein
VSADDASGTLLATSSVTTQMGIWSLLSVNSAAGITRVVIDSDRPIGAALHARRRGAVGRPRAGQHVLLALGAAGMIDHRLRRWKAGAEPTGVA